MCMHSLCELCMFLPGPTAEARSRGIARGARYSQDPARVKANLWTMRTSKGCLAEGRGVMFLHGKTRGKPWENLGKPEENHGKIMF